MKLRKWYRFGRLKAFGAPVYVHWSVLVAVAVLGVYSLSSPIYGILTIASYLSIITIHELGHAFAARRLAYRVYAVRIGFIHGSCEFEGPVYERDHIVISWAGVLAQLMVAVPVLLFASIFDDKDLGYLAPAVAFLGYVNLFVALLNLAPGAGFDGQTAWRVLPLAYRSVRRKLTRKKSVRLVKRKF